MSVTVLDQILEYWHSVRPEGGLPCRADIDPAKLKPCLSHMFIYDLEAPDFIRVKIFGTSVVDWLGAEPTGKNLLDFMPETLRDVYIRFFATILGHPCGAIGTYHIPPRSAGLMIKYLHLPMRDAEGQTCMIVGGAEYSSDAETELHLARPDSIEGDLSKPQLISLIFLDLGFGTPDVAPFLPEKQV